MKLIRNWYYIAVFPNTFCCYESKSLPIEVGRLINGQGLNPIPRVANIGGLLNRAVNIWINNGRTS